MKADLSKLKKENLIERFVSHGVPVEIYLDDSEYTAEESKRLRAEFFLTLAGVKTLPHS